jgi:hypothetical protein
VTSRRLRRAVTATCWREPYEVSNASTVRSAVLRPTTETGRSGVCADCPTESANGRFLTNSSWTSFSSSGKLKPLSQFTASHWSSGYRFEMVSQVLISGVKPSAPVRTWAWKSVSPLVVYSSAEMSGS